MLRNRSTASARFALSLVLFLALALGAVIPFQLGAAAASSSVVYDAVSATLPPNLPSVGFQATQTAEFGDYIHLAGTDRILRTVTVTMSDWAKYSEYVSDPRYSGNPVSWTHPITLNIYNVTPGAPLNQRGSLIATVTQTITIPWRPEPSAGCGTAWRAADDNCYNGLAFNATFDLSSLNVTLPNDIIVGVAYNTQTWGTSPVGVVGPYCSLNVGALGTTTVGTDADTDRVFWNTTTAAWYADGGAAGIGIFREDTNWTPNGTINFQITAAPMPADVYVDPTWSGVSAGQDPDGTGPATQMGYDAFTTIQAGVNEVLTGGNVHAAAGTYTEQVNITKALHLLGAGAGYSVIAAPATLPNSSLPTSAILLVNGSGVNAEITGFTITGPGSSGCGSIRAGIYVYGGANANIHHNTVQDIRDNPFSGCQNGVAIAIGRQAWSTTGTATIDHNTITGYQKGAIVVDNTGSSATITNNTVTGAGTTAVTAQNGIQISRGANATLSGNTVTGNSYHKADAWDWGAAGVLLYQAGSVNFTGGNTIGNNDQNVYVDSATGVTFGAEILGPSSAPLNSGYDVINYTTLPLDLTSVTFTGAADNFAIEDYIWHGVDDPTVGVVTWLANNLFVTPLSGSIQSAVDVATPGDTINVAAGTYDEQVVIDKPLTINGSGVSTLLQPTQATADGFTLFNRKFGGPLNTAGILVTDTTGNVIVSNLKVDGSLVTSVPAGADAFTGILFRGNPGTIHTVTVADIHDAGGASGIGMYLSGFDTEVTMVVSDNTITGYGKNGITASYATLEASLTGNTITGMGPTTTIAQNGIQMGYGATGVIEQNTISGNVWTGTYGGSNDPAIDDEADGAAGVLLYMPGAAVEINDNPLTGNQFGIWTVAAPSVNIHDNTITGLVHSGSAYPTGIAIWSADMWTTDMGGTETATSATIENNTISTNDYGVIVRDFIAGDAVPDVSLDGNTFIGNDTHVISTGDSVFDASGTLAGNTFDRWAMVAHSGNWLPAIWGKIQPAINAASAGDTIHLSSDTFIENVVVDKSVTLAGAGMNSTFVQPSISNADCGGGGGGSICPGGSNVILVQASNVVIHDLTVDGDNPSLSGGIDIGGANVDARNGIITNHVLGIPYNGLEIYNVNVENIYLRGIYASSGGSFNIHGNTVANVQGDPSSIAIFAFGGTGTISGNTVTDANDAIAANWSDGIQFLNNNVTRSATGIHTDNAGSGTGDTADLIQGNTISNCKTDGYGIFVFVPYLGPTVDDNTISGCTTGLSAWGQAVPVTTHFTNNTVNGPNKTAGSVGAYITTDQIGYGYNDITVDFNGNVITNFETGVLLTADEQTWTPGWTSQTVNATFHLNQIFGNTDGMTKGTTGVYVNDFEKNWWGAVSGPGPVGLGSGDTISADVDYSPWCTNPECTTFAPPFATQTTITADTPDASVVGQAVTVSVTVAGLPAGAFTPTGTVDVSDGGINCSITLVNGAGSCSLTFLTSGPRNLTAQYTPVSDSDFTASSDTESHAVNKATANVTTWPTATNITYGQTLADSTLSGGVFNPAGTFTFTTPSTRPNAGTALQSVTFTPTDTANYTPVTSTVSLTVNKAALSITANNTNKDYNGLAFNGGNGVAYSGFVNGETKSVLGGTLGYTGDSQGAINAGSYTIIPGGLTSGNYQITYHNGTLTVNKVALSVTANNASKTYDGLIYSGGYEVSYLGFVHGETSAALGGSLAFSGASQTAVNAGSYPIIPGGLTSVNYTISFFNGTLTIHKASQTITFGALADKTIGDADFTVTATASSTLPVIFTSNTPTVCTVTSGGLVHLAATGLCTINAVQAGNDNYNAAVDVERSFTVSLPVNHAPVITQGASVNVTMSVDGSPTPFALTLDATDADGDTLTWTVSTSATHGTASVSGTGLSKAITYTPDSGYTGSDTFVIQVSDGKGGLDTITVNVTINGVEPPTWYLYIPIIFHQ